MTFLYTYTVCPVKGMDAGSITMFINMSPSNVQMWHATTVDGKRRDFGLVTGPKPTSHPVFWFEGEVHKASESSTCSFVT